MKEKNESVLDMAKSLAEAVESAMDKNLPLPKTESTVGRKVTRPGEVAGEALIVAGFCLRYWSRAAGNKIDQKVDQRKADKAVTAAA